MSCTFKYRMTNRSKTHFGQSTAFILWLGVSSPHFPTKQEGEFVGKGELPVHTHIGYFSLCSSIIVFTFSFNDIVKCNMIASSGGDREEDFIPKLACILYMFQAVDPGLCHTYFSQHNAGSTHSHSYHCLWFFRR